MAEEGRKTVLHKGFTEVACKRRRSLNSRAWLQRFGDVIGVVKTDIFL